MTQLFNLDLTELRSALVYGFLVALSSVLAYAIQVGDVFNLDWRILVNIAFTSFSIFLISLIKNLLTDSEGKFAGLIKVK